MEQKKQGRMKQPTIWALLAIVVLLAIVPLFLHPESEFSGADGQAGDVILEIQPDAEPWFDPIWAPPGGETEGLLFALQAAIGAGGVGYFFGLKRGQKQARRVSSQNVPQTSEVSKTSEVFPPIIEQVPRRD